MSGPRVRNEIVHRLGGGSAVGRKRGAEPRFFFGKYENMIGRKYMKKLLLAATAIATLGTATPAFADGGNRNTDTEVFRIRANNPAKCNLEADDQTLRLANNRISDNDGFALNTVSADVAAALNGANVTAWCTGANNSIQMYRTALSTGDGEQTTGGFNQAVIYDVTLNIADATRTDGFSPIEGTSDGQGNGPGIGVGGGTTVSAFGPTGDGSTVAFAAESDSEAVNSDAPGTGGRSLYTSAQANRLAAGQYEGFLTIEVTPGV